MADTSKENVARMVAHFRKHDWAVVSHAKGTEKASDLIEALAAERDALAERVRVLEGRVRGLRGPDTVPIAPSGQRALD